MNRMHYNAPALYGDAAHSLPRSSRPPLRIQLITQTAFWPPYQGDSARLASMIAFFRREGARVQITHLHDPLQHEADYAAMASMVDRLSVYAPTAEDRRARTSGGMDAWCPAGLISRAVEDCRQFGTDIAIAQFVFLSKCLPSVADAGARLTVLDADNVFVDRARMWAAAEIPYSWVSTTVPEEHEALGRARLVLAIQQHEASYLQSLRPDAEIILTPHGVEPLPLPLPATPRVIFVGAENEENHFGLSRFLERQWPQVERQFRDAELLIVGAIGRRFEGVGGSVRVLGQVRELRDAYGDAWVAINTCTVGTGLKIKSVEALSFGRALVCTPSGAQGLEGLEGVLVTEPDGFAATLRMILGDCATALRLGRAAYETAQRHFSTDAAFAPAMRRMRALLAEAVERATAHPVISCAHLIHEPQGQDAEAAPGRSSPGAHPPERPQGGARPHHGRQSRRG